MYKSIVTLNFGGEKIGVEDANYTAEALTSIRKLNPSCSYSDSVGAKNSAKALKVNTSIGKLNQDVVISALKVRRFD